MYLEPLCSFEGEDFELASTAPLTAILGELSASLRMIRVVSLSNCSDRSMDSPSFPLLPSTYLFYALTLFVL